MRTIRRLYFYLVAFISLATVIWGVIYLAQTIFRSGVISQTNQLAGGFSLVLVGLPIFLLHWVVTQRDAVKDEEERSARVRALFFYGVRLGTLVPVVQNSMAVINRLMLQAVHINPSQAWLGGSETLTDNLVAIVVNLVALVYFEMILKAEWKKDLPGPAFVETRRLFRYIWMIYTFTIMVVGTQQIFFALFVSLGTMAYTSQVNLANAISLTLVGAPLWAWMWIFIQRQLDQVEEGRSLLRLVVLHVFALTGSITTISTIFIVIKDLGIWLTGETNTLTVFISNHSIPLSLLIVMLVIWLYFERHLRMQIDLEEDPIHRAGLLRFYEYILAVLGFGFLFSGMLWLGRVLIELAMSAIGTQALREGVNGSVSSLGVGMVVWIRRWIAAQKEARQEGEAGDHARRSLVRKGILYLAVFSGVVGTMTAAGSLLFLIFNVLLGGQEDHFNLELLLRIEALLVVGVWLAYYLFTLIEDGRFAHESLSQRHQNYPVILLGLDDDFAAEFTHSVQRIAAGLPVTHLAVADLAGAEETLQASQVLVMPFGLAIDPADELRQRLEAYTGLRLLVPLPQPGWVWLSSGRRSARDLARDAAQSVRQLSEGQEIRINQTGPWNIVLMVIGGFVAIQILFSLLAFGLGPLF